MGSEFDVSLCECDLSLCGVTLFSRLEHVLWRLCVVSIVLQHLLIRGPGGLFCVSVGLVSK